MSKKINKKNAANMTMANYTLLCVHGNDRYLSGVSPLLSAPDHCAFVCLTLTTFPARAYSRVFYSFSVVACQDQTEFSVNY